MNQTHLHNPPTEPRPRFGLIIIGDEILSGKRADKHLPKVIELLKARGLSLDYVEYVGDDPERIIVAIERAFASGDVVFSTGGIGATPDDHTRQCAARALGVPLVLHAQAKTLIEQRMQEMALDQGRVYDPEQADNRHRLNMGVFPQGAQIIPNPYNKIPGFFFAGESRSKLPTGSTQREAGPTGDRDSHVVGCGGVYFVPGFPVMAWPMIEWVLDTHYRAFFTAQAWLERSVIVFGAMEATLTPLMESIEREHIGIKVFSLPSVDHPQFGRHIELGVKGAPGRVAGAYVALLEGLKPFDLKLGPELVHS